MRNPLIVLCALTVQFAWNSSVQAKIIIDDFSVVQALEAPEAGTGNNPVQETVNDGVFGDPHINGSIILGDFRDTSLLHTSGSTRVRFETGPDLGGNTFKVLSEAGGAIPPDGQVTLTYDGDSDPTTLSPTGLNGGLGYDLTGQGDAFVFEDIVNGAGSTDVTGSVTVHLMSGTVLERDFLIVENFPALTDGSLDFTSFEVVGSPGTFATVADFSSVGAIVFKFDTNSATGTDLAIGNIVIDSAPQDSSLPTPEPASIIMFLMGFAALCFYGYRRRQQQLVGAAA